MKNKIFLVILSTILMISSSLFVNNIYGETTSISAVTYNGEESQDIIITPEISTKDNLVTATISPYDLSLGVTSSNRNRITYIKQSDLDNYINDNNIESVEIISGMGATSRVTASNAPKIIIVDDSNNVITKVEATGGQLRYDKKMNGTTAIGRYTDTNDKASAIDFADVRLQYKFTLPSDVNVTDTNWHWTVEYRTVSKTVNGKNYLPVKNVNNTYTSNVVVTGIPISENQNVDFKAYLTLSYVKDGIKYTIIQPTNVPLARNIKGLINYYKGNTVYSTLSENVKAYVDAVYPQLDTGSWTPVA